MSTSGAKTWAVWELHPLPPGSPFPTPAWRLQPFLIPRSHMKFSFGSRNWQDRTPIFTPWILDELQIRDWWCRTQGVLPVYMSYLAVFKSRLKYSYRCWIKAHPTDGEILSKFLTLYSFPICKIGILVIWVEKVVVEIKWYNVCQVLSRAAWHHERPGKKWELLLLLYI